VLLLRGRLILSDLGSLNARFVNAQRVKSAALKDVEVPLNLSFICDPHRGSMRIGPASELPILKK
jgi:pSer/pThr/pTyr-binding forkhead associated (FHA) protein